MASLAVLLQMSTDSVDGFTMIKDLVTLAKQNLKMLILTVPGERIMIPDYGVGLKQYLFSNFSETIYSEIEDQIRLQVGKYMPSIQIIGIGFPAQFAEENYLGIVIKFAIPQIGVTELLEFTI